MKEFNHPQFGIDLGRLLAHTYQKTPTELLESAQKIVDALELGVIVQDDTNLRLGLGWGLADRHKTPQEQATLEVMGDG